MSSVTRVHFSQLVDNCVTSTSLGAPHEPKRSYDLGHGSVQGKSMVDGGGRAGREQTWAPNNTRERQVS